MCVYIHIYIYINIMQLLLNYSGNCKGVLLLLVPVPELESAGIEFRAPASEAKHVDPKW